MAKRESDSPTSDEPSGTIDSWGQVGVMRQLAGSDRWEFIPHTHSL